MIKKYHNIKEVYAKKISLGEKKTCAQKMQRTNGAKGVAFPATGGTEDTVVLEGLVVTLVVAA